MADDGGRRKSRQSNQTPKDALLTPDRFRAHPNKLPDTKPARRKKRSKARRYRKEVYHDGGQPADNRDVESDHEIPSIAKIRLSSNTRKKLLEQRIAQWQERENKRHAASLYGRADNPSRYSRRDNDSRYSRRDNDSIYGKQTQSVHNDNHHPGPQLVKYNTYSLSSRGSHLPSVSVFAGTPPRSVKSGGQFLDVPEVEHETVIISQGHPGGRTRRTSVLDKAEHLLKARKRHEVQSSSGEETPRVPTQVRKQRLKRPYTYVAHRSKSPYSDTEYVEVPEVFDPTSDFAAVSPQPSLPSGAPASSLRSRGTVSPQPSLPTLAPATPHISRGRVSPQHSLRPHGTLSPLPLLKSRTIASPQPALGPYPGYRPAERQSGAMVSRISDCRKCIQNSAKLSEQM